MENSESPLPDPPKKAAALAMPALKTKLENWKKPATP